jgi:hypothetical protein
MKPAQLVFIAAAAGLVGNLMLLASLDVTPKPGRRCGDQSAIFRDPNFVVVRVTVDIATNCITSLEVRTP